MTAVGPPTIELEAHPHELTPDHSPAQSSRPHHQRPSRSATHRSCLEVSAAGTWEPFPRSFLEPLPSSAPRSRPRSAAASGWAERGLREPEAPPRPRPGSRAAQAAKRTREGAGPRTQWRLRAQALEHVRVTAARARAAARDFGQVARRATRTHAPSLEVHLRRGPTQRASQGCQPSRRRGRQFRLFLELLQSRGVRAFCQGAPQHAARQLSPRHLGCLPLLWPQQSNALRQRSCRDQAARQLHHPLMPRLREAALARRRTWGGARGPLALAPSPPSVAATPRLAGALWPWTLQSQPAGAPEHVAPPLADPTRQAACQP